MGRERLDMVARSRAARQVHTGRLPRVHVVSTQTQSRDKTMMHRLFASATLIGVLVSPIALGAQATHDHGSATACAKMSSGSADHANMDHGAHMAMMQKCQSALPTQPGQAAFGAISEIVRLLEADSTTDWSRVNIEALRQHLIDMDDVIMHAAVVQRSV